MDEITIIKEHHPIRCEICHQNDYFDQNSNYCFRCANIIQEKTIQLQNNIDIPIRFTTFLEISNEHPGFINRLNNSIKDFPGELYIQIKNGFNSLSSLRASKLIDYVLSINYKTSMLIPIYLLFTVLKFITGFIAIVIGLILLLTLQLDSKIFFIVFLIEITIILIFAILNWVSKFSWKYWLDNS
jgi:hypothetical protein